MLSRPIIPHGQSVIDISPYKDYNPAKRGQSVNRLNRLAKGDKVEVIDRNSEHYDKTGEVKQVEIKRVEFINTRRKQTFTQVEVRLDDAGTTVVFNANQLRRI